MEPRMAAAPRVLIVDDEETIVDLVRGYLGREGWEVAAVDEGRAAVAAVRDTAPDVVVLDLMRPGLDGIEVCRQLRTFSDAYVIMLTARSEEIDRIVGLSVGADDYLTKPFKPTGAGGAMTGQLTFEPASIEVGRGELVTFVARNLSDEAHEAYIGSDREQQLHATDHSSLSADDQDGATHYGYGIHVAPFGTGSFEYLFSSTDEVIIGCHYPGHYDAGMRATVRVTD